MPLIASQFFLELSTTLLIWAVFLKVTKPFADASSRRYAHVLASQGGDHVSCSYFRNGVLIRCAWMLKPKEEERVS